MQKEDSVLEGRTGPGHRGWEDRIGTFTKDVLEGHTGPAYRNQHGPSSVPPASSPLRQQGFAGLSPAPESLRRFPSKLGGRRAGGRAVKFLLQPGPWNSQKTTLAF